MVEEGKQLPHLTFDLQPLLVVLLLILIGRLEDTRAAGQGQLLSVHIVLHLAQWAADKGRPLPGTGEYSRWDAGHTGGSILGEKEVYLCSSSAVHLSLSSHLIRVPLVPGGWVLSF